MKDQLATIWKHTPTIEHLYKNELPETPFPPLSSYPSLISIHPKNGRVHLYDYPTLSMLESILFLCKHDKYQPVLSTNDVPMKTDDGVEI